MIFRHQERSASPTSCPSKQTLSENGESKRAKSRSEVDAGFPFCCKYGMTSISGSQERKMNESWFSTILLVVDLGEIAR
jgi:hypothetical protein